MWEMAEQNLSYLLVCEETWLPPSTLQRAISRSILHDLEERIWVTSEVSGKQIFSSAEELLSDDNNWRDSWVGRWILHAWKNSSMVWKGICFQWRGDLSGGPRTSLLTLRFHEPMKLFGRNWLISSTEVMKRPVGMSICRCKSKNMPKVNTLVQRKLYTENEMNSAGNAHRLSFYFV